MSHTKQANRRTCLFCADSANSREHVWPDWLVQSMKHRRPLRQTLGNKSAVEFTGDFKIRCVCEACNNGWMSDLEAKTKPLLGSLAADVSVQMDAQQQSSLAIWAVKTSMVIEAVKPQIAHRFYKPDVRKTFRESRSRPYTTRMWIGRYNDSGLFAAASEIEYNLTPLASPGFGSVTTMIAGHLVLQVLSLNFPSEVHNTDIRIQQRAGNWDHLVLPLWPYEKSLLWPPRLSFGNDPDQYPLTSLRDRWRVGAIS